MDSMNLYGQQIVPKAVGMHAILLLLIVIVQLQHASAMLALQEVVVKLTFVELPDVVTMAVALRFILELLGSCP